MVTSNVDERTAKEVKTINTEEKEQTMLFVNDVMERMRMRRPMVMQAIHSGDLPAETYGQGKNKYRVDPIDFEAWRKRHRVKEEVAE